MTVPQCEHQTETQVRDRRLMNSSVVKKGLVKEMVELMELRRSKKNGSRVDLSPLRANSNHDLEDRDIELELQYMALELSPYVSIGKTSDIIGHLKRHSPTPAQTAATQPTQASQDQAKPISFVISVIKSILLSVLACITLTICLAMILPDDLEI